MKKENTGTQMILILPPDVNMEVEKIQVEEKYINNGKLMRTKHDQVVRLIQMGIKAYRSETMSNL
jgi:hypothetical protein